MLKYPEQNYSSISSSNDRDDDSISTTSDKNNLSLIQLWEYIIKSKNLPDGVDLETVFETIHERLKNPEWEVRQHSLRVLVDLIPLIPTHTLDLKIDPVLGDLVTNLGHLGPAVRKGAVDSLRAYLNYSLYPDKVITDLVEGGIEKSQENKINTNVVLGIILSLPFLINSKLSESTITFVIHRLLNKLVKVIHQETVLRSLLRIREIVGHQVFNNCLDSYEGYNSRNDFELLCEVYDLNVFKNITNKSQYKVFSNKPAILDDNNSKQPNDRHEAYYKNDEEYNINLENTNVILETEIKLEYGPAITMKIHEESGHNNEKFIGVSKNDPFKVLPDELDFYEFRRRTPRRVRFGGEIIKLRTPDSDSNQQSDDNDATMSIYSDTTSNKPIIEIKYSEKEVKKSNSNRSQIPVPIKQTQSAPNSPKKPSLAKSKVFKSSPNLSKTKKVSSTQGTSRIPRRSSKRVKKSIETKIEIKIGREHIQVNQKDKKSEINQNIQINQKNKKSKSNPQINEKSEQLNFEDQKNPQNKKVNHIETKNKCLPVPTKPYYSGRRNSREDEFSPVPVHNEIEVLHNLTRSPSITKLPDINAKNTNTDNLDMTNGHTNLKKDSVSSSTPNLIGKDVVSSKNTQNEYASFHLCESSFYNFQDSPIPTKDSGECLTCSSSGSETVIVDKTNYEQLEFLDTNVIRDLHNMNDMNSSQRGLESLKRNLERPEVLNNIQDKLPSILHLLFTLEQQPLLQPLAEQTLNFIFANMDTRCLLEKLHHIMLYLSRAGSPLGVRLAILVMKRVSPKIVLDTLLSESIMGAKSSKVREGALQIIMTVSRIFPSTEIDVPKSVTMILLVLKDRKQKVRRVALETLAALAQLSSNGFVLETANYVFDKCKDKDHILKVIRTRLSRKQLPVVNLNGNIRYSSPTGQSEIDWLSHGCDLQQPSKMRIRSFSARDLKDNENNNNNIATNITKLENGTKINPKRIFSAQTENIVLSSTFSKEIENFVPSSPERFLEDLDIEKRRYLSGGYLESIDNQTYFNSCVENTDIAFINDQIKMTVASPIFDSFNHLPDINNGVLQTNQDSSKLNRSEIEASELKEYSSLSENSFDKNCIDPKQSNIPHSATSEPKLNYWKINSRKYEDKNIPITNNEDPKNRTPTTQFWAIDSSSLSSGEELSTTNGTLKQVYLVKANDTPVNKYKDGGTNTTPILKRTHRADRGRSFSPPSSSRQSDYDSYEEPSRFITSSYKYNRRYENVRKSYSTEFLSPIERVRKDSTASSESSSGSSIRQNGSRQKELRSGIPISTKADSKFRIRSKNVKKRTEPVSIPYYPCVKSASPHTTPEKLSPSSSEKVINRQPFSSGSESSGYFTPPRDSSNHGNSPEVSPRPVIAEEERFIQIETPKNSAEDLLISDNESDCDNNIEVIENIDVKINGTTFERINTSNSLKEFSNENLQEKEIFRSETALDEIDFTKITYSGTRSLSKSEVDIQISTQISRKNINSAPAVAEFGNINEVTVVETTCLPGTVDDSIENTEAPDELFGCSPPKRSPLKTPKPPLRRKSSRIVATPLLSETAPFAKPKEAYHDIIQQLESSEWEDTMKGLKGLVVLFKFHKELVENQMHTICVLLGKHIRNLRSQVARASCLAASELFNISKRPLEMELDELAGPLLHRTADTNRFLRSDANNALDEMSTNLSVPKVISVITFRGSAHQNAVIRCTSARLLCNIVHRLGPDKIFQLPRDTRDKILITGANMLTEGSLETRRHAKMLLGHLSSHCQFQRSLTEIVPTNVLRLIEKTLRSIIN